MQITYIALLTVLFISMTQKNTLQSAGQSFILTLPEQTEASTLRRWLAATKPAGVMLLASHVKNRAETKQLTAFLQAEAKKLHIPPLIIATDWEGGIVSRPSETGGFYSTPSPWLLAKLGPQACFKAGLLIGHQMRDVGITMDFAPSLDLFGKKILATRCFAPDEQTVANCGIAFSKGLMHAGIMPVIKHFPGLGFGQADTHDKQIVITIDPTLHAKQKLPFEQALEASVPAIMCSHGIYEEFGDMPVTRSSKAVTLLRSKNPHALLITDDFMMTAAWADVGQAAAVQEALEAGYDYIILSAKPSEQIKIVQGLGKENICRSATPNGAWFDKLRRSGENGFNTISLSNSIQQKSEEKPLLVSLSNHASKRWKSGFEERTKKRFLSPQIKAPLDERRLAQHLANACLQATYIPPLANKKVIMITTELPIIRPPEQWFINDDKSFLYRCLLERDTQLLDEFTLNPKSTASHEQLADVLHFIDRHPDATILLQTFFYADAIWNSIQQQWLEMLAPYADRLIIISLGHPEEASILPTALHIPLGSFHKPLLTSLAQRLAKPLTQGIDKLITTPEKYLQGKRFGVICNTSSVTLENNFLADILHTWAQQQEDNTQLVALFSPEHGLAGTHEAFGYVADKKTSRWGCPVYSLHGKHKKPTPAMLKKIDVMLIALPDVGIRCYTYPSTIDLTLEACSEASIPVILLDAINPLHHWGPSGPVLEKEHKSFVGHAEAPFIHGSSLGTLAKSMNSKRDAQLTIITSQQPTLSSGWYFKAPSPNLMTIDHVFAYPLTVLIEGTNYSEGRGTKHPFLQIGAPWVNAKELASELNKQELPGVYFQPISFTPRKMPGLAEAPKLENKRCHGVFVHILNHHTIQPVKTAESIIKTLFALYPHNSQAIKWGKVYGMDLLYGNDSLRLSLASK